jgi:hypothetical protein
MEQRLGRDLRSWSTAILRPRASLESAIDVTTTRSSTFFSAATGGQILDDPDQWTGYITQEPLLVDAGIF